LTDGAQLVDAVRSRREPHAPGADPHLSSLVERCSRACSFEKAEVELEHDQLELRQQRSRSGRRALGLWDRQRRAVRRRRGVTAITPDPLGAAIRRGGLGERLRSLPAAKLYEPLWKYDRKTLANDLSAHLVFVLATATALRLLSR